MSVPKEILYSKEAREKIVAGVNAIANAVKVTLGPMGRNVVIGLARRDPHITKDGVTVARNVVLKDPFENLGAQMVKGAATKAAENAGDGTTTATVLTQAIINIGLGKIDESTNVTHFNRGIQDACSDAIELMKARARQCVNSDDIRNIAHVSANGDTAISNCVKDAFELCGRSGTVMVREGTKIEDTVVHSKGISFDNGYLSQYFINNADAGAVDFKNPVVVLFDGEFGARYLESAIDTHVRGMRISDPLLFIVSDYQDDAIALAIRMQKKNINISIVKAPGFGDRRVDEMTDIAAVCGCELVSHQNGYDLDGVINWEKAFGRAISVKSTKSLTVIEFDCPEEVVKTRVDLINAQLSYTENEFLVSKLKERIAKLSGGVSTIVVGATTELELKERMDRYDDAVQATKAAIESGYLAGGGVTLNQTSYRVASGVEGRHPDYNLGRQTLIEAMRVPMTTILTNAGFADEVGRIHEDDIGYDVRKGELVNMIEAGVIDPCKVSCGSLQAAASIAGLILTTECAMVEEDTLPTIRV